MLRLHPDKRAKASELIHHAWLEGVVVQGELDLIKEAEEREAERKHRESEANTTGDVLDDGAIAGSVSVGIGGMEGEEDALKPVEIDEDAGMTDDELKPQPRRPDDSGHDSPANRPPEVIRVDKPLNVKKPAGSKR